MLQGLAGEGRQEIPEDSLVLGHPRRVHRIVFLDWFVIDDHGEFFLQRQNSAGQKIVELGGSNGR
jgi:hypothetical protein